MQPLRGWCTPRGSALCTNTVPAGGAGTPCLLKWTRRGMKYVGIHTSNQQCLFICWTSWKVYWLIIGNIYNSERYYKWTWIPEVPSLLSFKGLIPFPITIRSLDIHPDIHVYPIRTDMPFLISHVCTLTSDSVWNWYHVAFNLWLSQLQKHIYHTVPPNNTRLLSVYPDNTPVVIF